MINTIETIELAEKEWEEIGKELKISEDEINSSEYDYMDKD